MPTFVLVIGLLAGGCAAMAAPADNEQPAPWRHLSAAELQIAQALKDDFDRGLRYQFRGDVFRKRLLEIAQSGRSKAYYTLQLAFDPVLTMYEVTGDESYLQLGLQLGENMVRAADRDRDGDNHPEWDAERTPEQRAADHGRYDLMLHDFQGACPLTRAARIVLTDPALTARYGDRARRLLDFVEQHILNKWLYERNGLRWAQAIPLWSDKLSFIVRMELDLFAITGDRKHRDIAERIARLLHGRHTAYHPENDTITWRRYGPDTSHCNREVTMILQCYQDGVAFNRRDVQRLANTFLKLIWDGSREAPGFRNFHDGRNDPTLGRGPFEWGLIYDGWIKLGQYDPTIQEIGLTVWQQVKDRKTHLPGAKANDGKWAALALPANLLRNLVNRQTAPADPGASSN